MVLVLFVPVLLVIGVGHVNGNKNIPMTWSGESGTNGYMYNKPSLSLLSLSSPSLSVSILENYTKYMAP